MPAFKEHVHVVKDDHLWNIKLTINRFADNAIGCIAWSKGNPKPLAQCNHINISIHIFVLMSQFDYHKIFSFTITSDSICTKQKHKHRFDIYEKLFSGKIYILILEHNKIETDSIGSIQSFMTEFYPPTGRKIIYSHIRTKKNRNRFNNYIWTSKWTHNSNITILSSHKIFVPGKQTDPSFPSFLSDSPTLYYFIQNSSSKKNWPEGLKNIVPAKWKCTVTTGYQNNISRMLMTDTTKSEYHVSRCFKDLGQLNLQKQ